jgi:hypothetical protein
MMSAAPPPLPDNTEYDSVRMKHLYEMAAFRFRSAGDFAQLGLRSALLANGGALIAMLTFIGNRVDFKAGTTLWIAFGAFATGLLLSLVATLLAYRVQSAYARQETAGAEKIYFHTIGDTKLVEEENLEETHQLGVGRFWEWVAIACFIASLGAFMGGMIAGVDALTMQTQPAIPAPRSTL